MLHPSYSDLINAVNSEVEQGEQTSMSTRKKRSPLSVSTALEKRRS